MIHKYRAYVKKDKVMYNVVLIDYLHNKCWLRGENSIGRFKFKFDDIELMQSTGLSDKNGIEIFEGDIVTDGYRNQLVKFGKFEHEEEYGGIAQFIGFDLLLGCGYPKPVACEYEVIGHKFMPEFEGVFE